MLHQIRRWGLVAFTLWSSCPALAQPCDPAWDADFDLLPIDGNVRTLLSIESGPMQGLYVGGVFTTIAQTPAAHAAMYDGANWSPMGQGFNGAVVSFTQFQGEICAAGAFTFSGGAVADGVAQWSGADWQPLGAGLNNDVLSLATFDDGSGESLYAGGAFTASATDSVIGVARWTGANWIALGIGLQGGARVAQTMLAFDDGAGDALYVGGSFLGAGGLPAPNIAKWTGASWQQVGQGFNAAVRALVIYNGLLIAGGDFTMSGVTPISHLAQWDGVSWTPFTAGVNGPVYSLSVINTSTGDLLVVGGNYSQAGGAPANNIAAFDGDSWSTFDQGAASIVRSAARFQDALYVGANAVTPAGVSAIPLRKWILCDNANPQDLNGDGVVNGADLATLLIQWGAAGGPSDFNSDGVVDGADLATLLINWG